MHDVNASDIEDIIPYLKENLDVFVMIYQDQIISVLLPATVTYVIKDTMPGIK
jgi:elongation factor P